MTNRSIAALIGAGVLVLSVIITGFVAIGYNNDQNFQIVQSPGGEITIRDQPGFYWKGLSRVTTYPRAHQFEWGPVSVTFNDGGTADITGTMRCRTPVSEDARRLMHREFSADESLRNAERAINSHLVNAIKVTGPVMSGSEHQSARKGEFYNLVRSQLEDGLYQTRKVQRELLDQFDSEGRPITVYATEVVMGENGQPNIEEDSPLHQYDFDIAQFSIEETDYDPKTLELFAAKKESLLNAERSKAAREEEVQERLMIVERGLKEKAEIEAQANKEKARLTIEAETRVSVAAQEALQAEQIQIREQTEAETRRSVAELDLESERLRAEAVTVAAEAEEVRIAKAGAITEEARILAEIEKETRIGVAAELSRAQSPGFVISGGGDGSSGGTFENMLNVFLMRQLGVFSEDDITAPAGR